MKVKHKRCQHKIYDRTAHYHRVCKRKSSSNTDYCFQHKSRYTNDNSSEEFEEEFDIGQCYICKDPCNPCSQTCGRCARTGFMDPLYYNLSNICI